MPVNHVESAPLTSSLAGAGPILQINDADFGYSSRTVVHISELTLKVGEKISLVGPSGCGKTTLLAAIAGSSEPLRGQLELEGSLRNSTWRIQNVSRTLQAFPLLHWLTVKQNLKLACRIRGVSPGQVDEILHQLSASHLANLFPKQLSGGERCRASIAQSVVGNPKLLLLDEPFTGLDLLVKEDVARAMFDFAARSSISVVLVTHDLGDATNSHFSGRVIVLGKSPVTEIVADISTSGPDAANLVEATLKGHV